jgi:hypothetical protein
MGLRRMHRVAAWLLSLCILAAWAQEYTISTIAGGVPPRTPVPGLEESIDYPAAVASIAFPDRLIRHCDAPRGRSASRRLVRSMDSGLRPG